MASSIKENAIVAVSVPVTFVGVAVDLEVAAVDDSNDAVAFMLLTLSFVSPPRLLLAIRSKQRDKMCGG